MFVSYNSRRTHFDTHVLLLFTSEVEVLSIIVIIVPLLVSTQNIGVHHKHVSPRHTTSIAPSIVFLLLGILLLLSSSLLL